MGTHFHEHQADIVAWGWPLFCAKWARMIKAAAHDRWRQSQHQRSQQGAEDAATFADLTAALPGG